MKLCIIKVRRISEKYKKLSRLLCNTPPLPRKTLYGIECVIGDHMTMSLCQSIANDIPFTFPDNVACGAVSIHDSHFLSKRERRKISPIDPEQISVYSCNVTRALLLV